MLMQAISLHGIRIRTVEKDSFRTLHYICQKRIAAGLWIRNFGTFSEENHFTANEENDDDEALRTKKQKKERRTPTEPTEINLILDSSHFSNVFLASNFKLQSMADAKAHTEKKRIAHTHKSVIATMHQSCIHCLSQVENGLLSYEMWPFLSNGQRISQKLAENCIFNLIRVTSRFSANGAHLQQLQSSNSFFWRVEYLSRVISEKFRFFLITFR